MVGGSIFATTGLAIELTKGAAPIAFVVPVEGTDDLLHVTNTDNALFMNGSNSLYYALISGRWFTSSSLYGPWTFVASTDLSGDFQKIPSDHPKSNVLASFAGTPQARDCHHHSPELPEFSSRSFDGGRSFGGRRSRFACAFSEIPHLRPSPILIALAAT